ncbi:hypothetical protein Hanom_Chr13g01235361 [Helianthus anomalus]
MGSGQNGLGSKWVNYKKGLFWFGSERVRVRTGFGSKRNKKTERIETKQKN